MQPLRCMLQTPRDLLCYLRTGLYTREGEPSGSAGILYKSPISSYSLTQIATSDFELSERSKPSFSRSFCL